MDGVLIIDKPAGWTSHRVCQRVKRVLGCRRVGHTGTLDPIATGVLLLLIGSATKRAAEFAADEKEYLVTARFGVATTTYDCEGTITEEHPVPPDLFARVRDALPQFHGTLLQTPPPYSAVKHQGKPLYWWARQGRSIPVLPRSITVRAFECVGAGDAGGGPRSRQQPAVRRSDAGDGGDRRQDPPAEERSDVSFRILCSKGTYIRSLVHDVGQTIGCGAHVIALRRVRCGSFTIGQAIPLDQLRSC